jgi:hypothetical protein
VDLEPSRSGEELAMILFNESIAPEATPPHLALNCWGVPQFEYCMSFCLLLKHHMADRPREDASVLRNKRLNCILRGIL